MLPPTRRAGLLYSRSAASSFKKDSLCCSASSNAPTPAKTALITGKDGSYLAELLLEEGYVVHGNCFAED